VAILFLFSSLSDMFFPPSWVFWIQRAFPAEYLAKGFFNFLGVFAEPQKARLLPPLLFPFLSEPFPFAYPPFVEGHPKEASLLSVLLFLVFSLQALKCFSWFFFLFPVWFLLFPGLGCPPPPKFFFAFLWLSEKEFVFFPFLVHSTPLTVAQSGFNLFDPPFFFPCDDVGLVAFLSQLASAGSMGVPCGPNEPSFFPLFPAIRCRLLH